MLLRPLLLMLLLSEITFGSLPGQTALKLTDSGDDSRPGHTLARLTSWVLFRGGRVARGTPFLAYGYLSEVEALSQARPQAENESSAVLTFVVEGTVEDLQQNAPAFMIESQGMFRVFFDPHARRDFTRPESFRSGREVATYNLRRQVLFNPDGGWLYDRSFVSLVSSQRFTFKEVEVNLLRLWGAQLTIRAQARVEDGLPSPLPEYTGAVPYTGQLFADGERTDRVLPPVHDGASSHGDRDKTGNEPSMNVYDADLPSTAGRRGSFLPEKNLD